MNENILRKAETLDQIGRDGTGLASKLNLKKAIDVSRCAQPIKRSPENEAAGTSIVCAFFVICFISSAHLLPAASECRNRNTPPLKTNNANELLSDLNIEVGAVKDVLGCADILTA
ncbi:uncharacterized protein LOC133320256 [Danaus plexippus]|uniref:uncharacterized protein LOC133320256 n=1 Tax=Danaus plexippus TaxID=13037 RepID=UPI002AB2159E|nr:uncharacterized protein LOC133320256 [Danaus plexippus]